MKKILLLIVVLLQVAISHFLPSDVSRTGRCVIDMGKRIFSHLLVATYPAFAETKRLTNLFLLLMLHLSLQKFIPSKKYSI